MPLGAMPLMVCHLEDCQIFEERGDRRFISGFAVADLKMLACALINYASSSVIRCSLLLIAASSILRIEE